MNEDVVLRFAFNEIRDVDMPRIFIEKIFGTFYIITPWKHDTDKYLSEITRIAQKIAFTREICTICEKCIIRTITFFQEP
jgi:hypothetical protein